MPELFLKIINMSISASWLVLAVLILRFVLKRAPKWANVLLWGIVAVRLLCPLSIESAFSLIPSAETISPDIMMDAAPSIQTGIPAINSIVNPVISQSFTPAPTASANPLQIWIPLLSIVWAVGAAALFLYTAISYWRLRGQVGTAVLLLDNIFQSENVSSPFVLGVIKPKIFLPFQMAGQNLAHVVAHEQAHIQRRDHWWKPLGFLLLTVHWFNPLIWLAYVLLCRDIELACDEKVIKELGSEQRADYTQALLACSINRRMITACPLAFGEVGVKERVKSVMNYRKPAFWVTAAAVVTCLVVAVCFLTNPARDQMDELPLLHSRSYGVVEVTYETLGTSFSMVAQQNTPVYAITENMQLMSKGEHSTEDEWTNLGTLTEIDLTRETFDALFFSKGKWFGNETASSIRKNAAHAWTLVYDQHILYYVLQQKNGEVYLAYGYCDYAEKDDPGSDDTNIRWLFKLAFGPHEVHTTALSLSDVLTLSQKGYDLTWDDFERYDHIDIGSGLYIWEFKIDEMFSLRIGGSTQIDPMYIHLEANDGTDSRIDIRDGGATDFIELHKGNPVVTECTAGWQCSPVGYSEDTFAKMIELGGISNNAMSSGIRALPAVKISGAEELRDFMEAMSPHMNFNYSAYPDAQPFSDIMKAYDDSFFASSTLFLLYTPEPTTAIRHSVEYASLSGQTLSIGIRRLEPDSGDTAMEGWLIAIGIPSGQIPNVDEVDARISSTVHVGRQLELVKSYAFKEGSGTTVSLYDSGEFSFTFSMVSSYWGHGAYDIKENRLTLRTNDGDFVYVFDMVGDTLVFDADASSEQTWFSNLYDGAVLE